MRDESGFGLAGGTGRKLYIASIVARYLSLFRRDRIYFRFRRRSFNISETVSTAIN